MRPTVTAGLMKLCGFTDEATDFVLQDHLRYVPLLADLAYFAERHINLAVGAYKDELLRNVEDWDAHMKWRTSMRLERAGIYNYLFVIETGYSSQIVLRAENYVPVTEPKMMKITTDEDRMPHRNLYELLRRDGFRGKVYDLRQLALVFMRVNCKAVIEHEFKGNKYVFFVASDKELRVVKSENLLSVEPSDALCQSLITRLAKGQKSKKALGRENQHPTEERPVTGSLSKVVAPPSQGDATSGTAGPGDGNGKGVIRGQGEPSIKSSRPEFPGDAGGNAERPGNNCNVCGGAASPPFGTGDMSSSCSEGFADAALPSAEEVRQDRSHAIDLPFYRKLSSKSTPRRKYKGGGAQLNTYKEAKKAVESPIVKEALLSLATAKSTLKDRNSVGLDFIKKKQFVKDLLVRPHRIADKTGAYAEDKVIFCVDTSGSVSHFADFILRMIKSATSSDRIATYSGCEGRPIVNERTGKKILANYRDFPEHIDKMLRNEQPAPDTTIVFWGDMYISHMAVQPHVLAKMCRQYRCVWLCSTTERENKFPATISEFRKAGFKILFGINNERAFANALKSLT